MVDINTEPQNEVKVIEPKSSNLYEFATNINPEGYDLYQALFNQRQPIPTQEELTKSRELNRSQGGQPKGLWQIAVKAERESLKKGMQNYAADIFSKVPETLKQLVTRDRLEQLVDFLPNFNFPYYNKLIKVALKGIASNTLTTTRADYSHIQGMRVLNLEAERTFLALLKASQNPASSGFSVVPPTSRSRIPLKYDNGEARLELRNPGTIFMQDDTSSNSMVNAMNKIVEVYDNKLRQIQENIELAQDQGHLLDLTGVRSELGKTVVWMMDKLSDSHISMKDLMLIAEKLHSQVGLKRSRYFLSLAQPWKHRTARVPALINPPSATFSLRGIIPLTTNATGNVAFVFNPFFLTVASSVATTFGVNNNVALSGTGSSNFFTGIAIGQTLPADFYIRYRLVSSGLRLYCYPSSNNDNGIASVAVTFEDLNYIGAGGILANAAQFGDFTQIENGYFKQTSTIASREVQEHVYIPIDESFLDYRPVENAPATTRSGFAWTGYISGAAASSTIARVEFVCNFEALLDNAYTDYLPSDIPNEEVDPKQIPIIINKLKQEEYLSPSKISDVLKDENVGVDINDIIEVPTPPKKKKLEQEKLKNESKELSDILKDMISTVPKPKASSWVSDIMDMVSPITSSIIQGVASKYVPFLPMFGKF